MIDKQPKSEEKTLPEPTPAVEIEPIELNLAPKSGAKRIMQSLKRNVNVRISDLKKTFKSYLAENAEEVASGIVTIAPFGEYAGLLDEPETITAFLRGEASKPENWKIIDIKPMTNEDRALVEFKFSSIAADDGDCLTGFVYVDAQGEVMHSFVHGR